MSCSTSVPAGLKVSFRLLWTTVNKVETTVREGWEPPYFPKGEKVQVVPQVLLN